MLPSPGRPTTRGAVESRSFEDAKKREMPLDNVRVAVVGCGYWGRNLVRNFSALGALEVLVDVSKSTVDALIEKHGGRGATFAEVLKDSTIDAVVVGAPAAQHYPLA